MIRSFAFSIFLLVGVGFFPAGRGLFRHGAYLLSENKKRRQSKQPSTCTVVFQDLTCGWITRKYGYDNTSPAKSAGFRRAAERLPGESECQRPSLP